MTFFSCLSGEHSQRHRPHWQLARGACIPVRVLAAASYTSLYRLCSIAPDVWRQCVRWIPGPHLLQAVGQAVQVHGRLHQVVVTGQVWLSGCPEGTVCRQVVRDSPAWREAVVRSEAVPLAFLPHQHLVAGVVGLGGLQGEARSSRMYCRQWMVPGTLHRQPGVCRQYVGCCSNDDSLFWR